MSIALAAFPASIPFAREPDRIAPSSKMKIPPVPADTPPSQKTVAVTHHGARFELAGIVDWPAPTKPGAVAEIDLKLTITNTSSSPLRFSLFDTLRVSLTDSRGQPLLHDGGRNATKAGEAFSPLLAPGEIFLVVRRVHLTWIAADTLRLQGDDGFGGIWYFDGLKPSAAYNLKFVYRTYQYSGVDQLWVGEVTTPALTIIIR
jgi:hypothetical protein